jgi:hypothetical protein
MSGKEARIDVVPMDVSDEELKGRPMSKTARARQNVQQDRVTDAIKSRVVEFFETLIGSTEDGKRQDQLRFCADEVIERENHDTWKGIVQNLVRTLQETLNLKPVKKAAVAAVRRGRRAAAEPSSGEEESEEGEVDAEAQREVEIKDAALAEEDIKEILKVPRTPLPAFANAEEEAQALAEAQAEAARQRRLAVQQLQIEIPGEREREQRRLAQQIVRTPQTPRTPRTPARLAQQIVRTPQTPRTPRTPASVEAEAAPTPSPQPRTPQQQRQRSARSAAAAAAAHAEESESDVEMLPIAGGGRSGKEAKSDVEAALAQGAAQSIVDLKQIMPETVYSGVPKRWWPALNRSVSGREFVELLEDQRERRRTRRRAFEGKLRENFRVQQQQAGAAASADSTAAAVDPVTQRVQESVDVVGAVGSDLLRLTLDESEDSADPAVTLEAVRDFARKLLSTTDDNFAPLGESASTARTRFELGKIRSKAVDTLFRNDQRQQEFFFQADSSEQEQVNVFDLVQRFLESTALDTAGPSQITGFVHSEGGGDLFDWDQEKPYSTAPNESGRSLWPSIVLDTMEQAGIQRLRDASAWVRALQSQQLAGNPSVQALLPVWLRDSSEGKRYRVGFATKVLIPFAEAGAFASASASRGAGAGSGSGTISPNDDSRIKQEMLDLWLAKTRFAGTQKSTIAESFNRCHNELLLPLKNENRLQTVTTSRIQLWDPVSYLLTLLAVAESTVNDVKIYDLTAVTVAQFKQLFTVEALEQTCGAPRVVPSSASGAGSFSSSSRRGGRGRGAQRPQQPRLGSQLASSTDLLQELVTSIQRDGALARDSKSGRRGYVAIAGPTSRSPRLVGFVIVRDMDKLVNEDFAFGVGTDPQEIKHADQAQRVEDKSVRDQYFQVPPMLASDNRIGPAAGAEENKGGQGFASGENRFKHSLDIEVVCAQSFKRIRPSVFVELQQNGIADNKFVQLDALKTMTKLAPAVATDEEGAGSVPVFVSTEYVEDHPDSVSSRQLGIVLLLHVMLDNYANKYAGIGLQVASDIAGTPFAYMSELDRRATDAIEASQPINSRLVSYYQSTLKFERAFKLDPNLAYNTSIVELGDQTSGTYYIAPPTAAEEKKGFGKPKSLMFRPFPTTADLFEMVAIRINDLMKLRPVAEIARSSRQGEVKTVRLGGSGRLSPQQQASPGVGFGGSGGGGREGFGGGLGLGGQQEQGGASGTARRPGAGAGAGARSATGAVSRASAAAAATSAASSRMSSPVAFAREESKSQPAAGTRVKRTLEEDTETARQGASKRSRRPQAARPQRFRKL